MTWIKTIPIDEASPELREAFMGQAGYYPAEYTTPVGPAEQHSTDGDGPGIIKSHSLLPKTLFHSFSTYGTLLDPNLPLSRRQHEMIAATVSALNRCFY